MTAGKLNVDFSMSYSQEEGINIKIKAIDEESNPLLIGLLAATSQVFAQMMGINIQARTAAAATPATPPIMPRQTVFPGAVRQG
jgi:hypothetical protein